MEILENDQGIVDDGALDLDTFGADIDENAHSAGCGFPLDRLPNPMRADKPLLPFEGEFAHDAAMLLALGLPLGFLNSPFDLDKVRSFLLALAILMWLASPSRSSRWRLGSWGYIIHVIY